MCHDPIRVFLVEFALLVGHFGLNPDAELQPSVFGSLYQSRHSGRQFLGVGHPVAEALAVVGAAVLSAEPSVVHDEEFASQVLDAVHHLLADFLVDVHVDALP